MIDLSNFFSFDRVSDAEFEEYLKTEFSENFKVERIIYIIILVIFNIIFIPSVIFFYKLRNSYIIRQRNFTLTLFGGIAAYINAIIGFLPQIFRVPCPVPVYSVNVLNPLVNLIFFSRSLRVILFYHLNIYKVSSVKSKVNNRTFSSYGEKEPNNYLPKIYRKINTIITYFVAVPVILSFLHTVTCHIKYYDTCKFNQIEDTLIGLKNNNNEELFIIVPLLGRFYIFLSVIITIALLYVKDANKYGVKFECLSTSIMLLISSAFNAFLQVKATKPKNDTSGYDKNPQRVFLNLFEVTKGGKMLFNILSIYILFASITLPVIKYYKSKKERNKYFQEPMSSMQYFYKVLNSPLLVNELRTIAVQEFSVENVLFWENYKVLQKMVYRYQVEYNRAKACGNEDMINQYDFEGYYIQQMQSISSNSSPIDDYTYDPTLLLPKEILPFYTSFYHTYIDYNSPAAVNISGECIRQIQNELCQFPTIGMFDNAKNEVVEMMYSSIFPILLRKNKRDLHNAIL